MKPEFTEPKLVKYNDFSKPWYVYFRYRGKLFRYTCDLNRIKDFTKRLKEFEALRISYYKKLKSGWNPLVPVAEFEDGSDMTLYQSLEFAIDKKAPHIDPKTLSGYNGTVRFCKESIRALGLGHLPIAGTKRVHIKALMEDMKKQRKWSNKAYNKHLGHLQAVLSELIQWDVIQFNPAHNIKMMKVEDAVINTPTSSEVKKIISHLKSEHPDFYEFVSVIYHTGIRPVEITKLKFEMVDLENRLITLPPIITKNRKRFRVVPINDFLWKDLKNRLTSCNNNEYYLFGSYRPSGKGNVGLHKDFVPGPTKMNRDTATKRWEKVIKIGLGINVNMYSMKHYGADMKILAGVDLEALQTLYGHTSKLTTQIYAKQIKTVHRRQILELSPDF
jgi:integrase